MANNHFEKRKKRQDRFLALLKKSLIYWSLWEMAIKIIVLVKPLSQILMLDELWKMFCFINIVDVHYSVQFYSPMLCETRESVQKYIKPKLPFRIKHYFPTIFKGNNT